MEGMDVGKTSSPARSMPYTYEGWGASMLLPTAACVRSGRAADGFGLSRSWPRRCAIPMRCVQP